MRKSQITLTLLVAAAAVLVAVCGQQDALLVPETPEAVEPGTLLVPQRDAVDGWVAGDAVADEDDPDEEDTIECDGVLDCWEKCKEWEGEYDDDGGTTSCECKPTNGGQWSCDAKWWEEGDPDGRGGGGGGGGGTGGCGGGIGDDTLRHGGGDCPGPPIAINGLFSVERGQRATFRAALSSEWDTLPGLHFAWRSGKNTHGGPKGVLNSDEWSGTATRTQGLALTVTSLGNNRTRRATDRKRVTVNPRDWQYLAGNAGITAPRTVPGGWERKMGVYIRGLGNKSRFLNTAAGSGPWSGDYILQDYPKIDFPDLVHWHPHVTSAGPKYRGADQTCDSVSVSRANLWTVNDACGYRQGPHQSRHGGCEARVQTSRKPQRLSRYRQP